MSHRSDLGLERRRDDVDALLDLGLLVTSAAHVRVVRVVKDRLERRVLAGVVLDLRDRSGVALVGLVRRVDLGGLLVVLHHLDGDGLVGGSLLRGGKRREGRDGDRERNDRRNNGPHHVLLCPTGPTRGVMGPKVLHPPTLGQTNGELFFGTRPGDAPKRESR